MAQVVAVARTQHAQQERRIVTGIFSALGVAAVAVVGWWWWRKVRAAQVTQPGMGVLEDFTGCGDPPSVYPTPEFKCGERVTLKTALPVAASEDYDTYAQKEVMPLGPWSTYHGTVTQRWWSQQQVGDRTADADGWQYEVELDAGPRDWYVSSYHKMGKE